VRIFIGNPVQICGMITLLFLLPFFALLLLFFPLRPNGPYRSVRVSEPKCWFLLGNWRTEIVRTLIRSKENEQWWRFFVLFCQVFFSYWQIEHISI